MSPAKDYTFKIYSQQDLAIQDERGSTNEWRMDGKRPSGFTKSSYRFKGTDNWQPDGWIPQSMKQVLLASQSPNDFFSFVELNPWTLLKWF